MKEIIVYILDNVMFIVDYVQKIVIIWATIKAINAFRRYRAEQRSQSAAQLKGLFQEKIINIIETASIAESLKQEHLNEKLIFLLEELPDSPEKPVSFKPSRMIAAQLRELEAEFYVLTAKIGRTDARMIKGKVYELKQYCVKLGAVLILSLSKKKSLAHLKGLKKIENNYRKDLEKILYEVEMILDPIIE